jgi:DNA-binding NarL/FixJ family response regulator
MYQQIISLREQEILTLIALEYRMYEVAKELFISPNTVQTHDKHLLEKMEVKDVAGLIRKSFEKGYFKLEA